MYLLSGDKSECCGCGACAHVCPHSCIRMTTDEDGFVFPTIDREKCINCHLCEKVCPVENIPINTESRENQIIVSATSKNADHVMKSASGGAFGEIVSSLRENEEWYVWGAAFDENLQLVHCFSKNENDLAPLHKSKYLQSNLKDSFLKIKKQLSMLIWMV